MYFLKQMMKTTTIMLEETKRRERALQRILHVLRVAAGQKEHTKTSVILMLKYETIRQKRELEEMRICHKCTKKQMLEREKGIRLYEEYVEVLAQQKGD